MYYKIKYLSPLGTLVLVSDKENLIGLFIKDQKHFLDGIDKEAIENHNIKILQDTKEWLDKYFNKENPSTDHLKIKPLGNEFRQNVFKVLQKIPYGKTTTYKKVAIELAKIMKKKNMSAQAIGTAISNNPILIIIPCHRVINSNGKLGGYVGGIDKKIQLLKLENIEVKNEEKM